MTTTAGPGSWQADPAGRHEYRWHDGTNWSDYVSDGGVTSSDPLQPTMPPVGAALGASQQFPSAGFQSSSAFQSQMPREMDIGKQRKKHKGIWIGAVAIIIIVAIVAVSSSKPATVDQGNPTASTSPSKSSSTTPSTSSLPRSSTGNKSGRGVYSIGATVSIPNTFSGISKVTISGWYPNVHDTSALQNTPSSGRVWDAIDATTCAGSRGSQTGPDETDFSVLLANGSSAETANGAGGSQFSGALASLSELGYNLSTLAPNQCTRGWIVFSVPQGTTPQYVQFSGTSASFTQSNSNVKWRIPG